MDGAEDPPASLDSVAGDLYALAPGEFVAARDSAAKSAKAAGQRELSGQIRRLPKPTTVAWLANQLVRAHRAEIEPLLQLGADLREATASLKGDELRRLSSQQHQVISALVQQARRLARSAGQQVTEATARGLEETLRAALADGDLAAELTRGQLSGPLEHVGFELGSGVQPSPGPSASRQKLTDQRPADAAPEADSKKDAAEQKRAAERARAEQELAEAESAAAEATAAAEAAGARLEKAAEARAGLDEDVRRLESELEQATHQRAEAHEAENEARSAREKAARAAERARKRLAAARASIDKL